MKTFRVVLTFVSSVSFVFLGHRPVSAQIYETVGTRAQGMGGAFVAVADDATATWWNPAGLILTYFSAVAEQSEIDDPQDAPSVGPVSRSVPRSFAVTFPALGLSYYRLRISEIAPAISTETGQAVRQDLGVAATGVRSRLLNEFGATVGQSLGGHVILASTFKIVRAGVVTAPSGSLDDASALDVPLETSGDLDIGGLVRFGRTRVGVTVKHLNEPTFGEGKGALVLKRQARAGIAWIGGQPLGPAMITTAFDADLTKTSTLVGDVRHISAGAELLLTRQKVSLRGGISSNTLGDVTNSGSFGASIGVLQGVYLDGAKTFGSDRSRSGWSVGLRLTI